MQALLARFVGVLISAVLMLGVPASGNGAPRKQVSGYARLSARVHHRKRPVRLPRDFAAWTRVARCESGGWVVLGDVYPDSLGIDRTNYLAFGGRPQPRGRVSRAGIVAQIRVADRLIRRYRVSIPDRFGCAAW